MQSLGASMTVYPQYAIGSMSKGGRRRSKTFLWYKDGLMMVVGLTFDDDLTFVSRDLQSNRGVGSARSFVYLSERWGLQYKAAQA